MGSIVPGAGAVPGAGREDPGEGSKGEEGKGNRRLGRLRVGAKEKIRGKKRA